MTLDELKRETRAKTVSRETFHAWLDARNRSCLLMDRGYHRFSYDTGFLMAHPAYRDCIDIAVTTH